MAKILFREVHGCVVDDGFLDCGICWADFTSIFQSQVSEGSFIFTHNMLKIICYLNIF